MLNKVKLNQVINLLIELAVEEAVKGKPPEVNKLTVLLTIIDMLKSIR